MSKIEIEKIFGYYSTDEIYIKDLAKKADQIMLMKGIEAESEIIKVVMVFNDKPGVK